ncbi:MAG TPA: hypothetical protein PLZ36_01920 [Armatimonadota bacterium]|nr:hypothetical protein [Armatimonadota bacterium]
MYDDAMTVGKALRALEAGGEGAVVGLRAVNAALGESEARMEQFVRAFHRQAASLQTQWRRTVDAMLVDVARWLEGMNDGARGFTALDGGMGGIFGAVGSLVGLATGDGKRPRVTFGYPAVPRPPGALLPDPVESGGRAVAVTVAEGAVQITAPTLDEAALAHAAETLAARLQERLAFEDRRVGRLSGG